MIEDVIGAESHCGIPWRLYAELQVVEGIGTYDTATGQAARVQYRDPRPGDVPHSQAANSTLTQLFPDLAPVSLEDGLRETWEWMRAYLAAT